MVTPEARPEVSHKKPCASRARLWCALLVLTLLLSAGCHKYLVPERAALEACFEPVTFVRRAHSHHFSSFEELDAVVCGLDPVPTSTPAVVGRGLPGRMCVGQFLHLSDAQIRDEEVYSDAPWYREQMKKLDKAFPHTIRNPYVQAFDSLTFASFLIGYAKQQTPGAGPHTFALHSGDLLDVSLITELVESLRIMRRFAQSYEQVPLYSMAGNHDGLTFGNLPDKDTNTTGLGVNETEFILGHLLAHPAEEKGFGFELNEIIEKVVPRQSLPSAEGTALSASQRKWLAVARRQISDMRKSAQSRSALRASTHPSDERPGGGPEWYLSNPAVFRNAIRTTSEGIRSGLKCGYYSWTDSFQDEGGHQHTLRYITLDTRSSVTARGDIDGVQLGWLYNQLNQAMRDRECVVLFAHHGPDAIAWPGRSPRGFFRLLKKFSNIAAYFYGHTHKNQEFGPKSTPDPTHPQKKHAFGDFLLFETGSLADFPQTARLVKVFVPTGGPEEHSGTDGPRPIGKVGFSWQHVRPKCDRSRWDGLLLEAVLHASLRGAKKDRARWSATENLEPVDSWEEWAKRKLPPGYSEVSVRFLSVPPSPEECFGRGRLAKINTARGLLGLGEVLGSPPSAR